MPTFLLAAALTSDSSGASMSPREAMTQTVTEVSNLAKVINEYGPLIVALALIMVLLIIVMGFMLYRTNKTINELQKAAKDDETQKNEQINKLLDHLLHSTNFSTDLADQVSEKLNDRAEDEERKDIVGMYIDVNMAFKSASRVALNKLRCSRIAIYVFHNGNTSLHGLPFFKMSCVHEWTIRGSKTMRGRTHFDMPLHLYDDIIEALANDDEYIIADVQQQGVNSQNLMDFVMPSSTKALYMVAIRDSQGTLAGFSIAEYAKEVDFTDHDFFMLNKQALTDLNEAIKDIVLQEGFINGFKH